MRVLLRPHCSLKVLSHAFSSSAPAYDWRDDPIMNPTLDVDPARIGVPDPRRYELPYKGRNPKHMSRTRLFPQEYNVQDLSMNFVGTVPMLSIAETNEWDPPIQVKLEAMAHEYEYDSEDADFQSLNFKTQHFRKKGKDIMWLLCAMIPAIAFFLDHIYFNMLGSYNMVYQRPPPFGSRQGNVSDARMWQTMGTPNFKIRQQAGTISPPHFDVREGEKVYHRFAGVNTPHPTLPIFVRN